MRSEFKTLEEVNAWLATQPPQDHPWAVFWGCFFLILIFLVGGYVLIQLWKRVMKKWKLKSGFNTPHFIKTTWNKWNNKE